MKQSFKAFSLAFIAESVLLVSCHRVGAQSLRFYPSPYQVYDGDSVQFHYVDSTNTVSRTNILSWSWDFNNDGVVDASGNLPEGIDATWTAAYDPFSASPDGILRVAPTLTITYPNPANGNVLTLIETCMTAPVGLATNANPHLLLFPPTPL